MGSRGACPLCAPLLDAGDELVRCPHQGPATPPARPSRPALDARAHLARVLGELDLAARYRRQALASAGGPAQPRCPLGSWQGLASGADADATDLQVRQLWRLVTDPSSRVGRRARAAFTAALEAYLDAARGDGADVDWAAARRAAERLAALAAGDDRQRRAAAVLTTLQRRCLAAATWDGAARLVAIELAPPALVVAWDAPARGPRDYTRPTTDDERTAWGGRLLAAAIEAWCAATEAGT